MSYTRDEIREMSWGERLLHGIWPRENREFAKKHAKEVIDYGLLAHDLYTGNVRGLARAASRALTMPKLPGRGSFRVMPRYGVSRSRRGYGRRSYGRKVFKKSYGRRGKGRGRYGRKKTKVNVKYALYKALGGK